MDNDRKTIQYLPAAYNTINLSHVVFRMRDSSTGYASKTYLGVEDFISAQNAMCAMTQHRDKNNVHYDPEFDNLDMNPQNGNARVCYAEWKQIYFPDPFDLTKMEVRIVHSVGTKPTEPILPNMPDISDPHQ